MSDRTDAFQRVLDEAARKGRAPDDRGAVSTGGARVREVAFGPASASGGKARVGLAGDGADDPPDRPPLPLNSPRREPAWRSDDTSTEIAAELGLGAAPTLNQLT